MDSNEKVDNYPDRANGRMTPRSTLVSGDLVVGGSGGVAYTAPVISTVQGDIPDFAYLEGVGFDFAATGGSGNYSWSVEAGPLPDALILDSDGHLHGTITDAAGTYAVTIRCTDTTSLLYDEETYVITVTDWLSQILSTNRTAAWLSDQSSYFSLTGNDVNTWYEADGNSDLDLSYVATDSKSIYDTTHPVNTTGKTVRTGGFLLSRYAAGAAGKSSVIWPTGKGSLFIVVKIIGAVSDGALSSNDGIFRHGDTSSWGGLVQIAGRAGGVSGYRIRATCYDGATKTVDHNVADEIPAGWHVIAIRNDGSNLSLKVDNYTENQTPCGAMSYVDGVIRALSPYSTGQDVAIPIMLAYSAYDTITRDTVIGQLQSIITDLP